jgi:threonine dehydrogenase-like Zn-dependent dehydrogenase
VKVKLLAVLPAVTAEGETASVLGCGPLAQAADAPIVAASTAPRLKMAATRPAD